MTKLEICKKAEEMVIAANPLLANKDYRKRLPAHQKAALVVQLMDLAKKIEIFNS